MSILTQDEIDTCQRADNLDSIYRATEQAILTKLAAGVGVESDTRTDTHQDGWGQRAYTVAAFNTAIAAARVQALEEAANIAESGNAAAWCISGQIARGIRALLGKEST